MAVARDEKQGTKALSDELECRSQNRMENYLSDLTRRQVHYVDSYVKDDQQGLGKHELNRSRWTGDL